MLLKEVNMKRLTVFLIALLILSAAMFGCAAQYGTPDAAPAEDYYAKGEYITAEEAGYDMEAPAAPQEATDGSSGFSDGGAVDYDGSLLQPGVDRKIIFSGYLSIQTTSFEQDYQQVLDALIEFGGYVENESTSGKKPVAWNDPGRTANLTLRVPSRSFDAFLNKLKGFGETLSVERHGQDISLQYFDTETRLKTLRTREARLLDLLEEAKGLEDIINLERELANVAYDIQMHETNLRNYDSLIDYSTVSISIREVNEVERVTPAQKDLGSRISSGFYSVLNVLAVIGEGLLIFLIAGSPVLIPLAVILIIVLVLVKRSKKKKAQKQNNSGM